MSQQTLSDYQSSGVECPVCKDRFKSNKGFGPHFRAKHPNKHAATERVREAYGGVPKAALLEWHHEDGMTTREISSEFNIPRDGLREVFNKCDVATLGGDKPYVSFRTSQRGYETWRHMIDGERHMARVHRLIAVAEHGVGAVSGNVVHHKNGVPWDNRPENLEVMDERTHLQEHYKERQIGDDGRFK